MPQPNSNTASATQNLSNQESSTSQPSEAQSNKQTNELANLVKKVDGSQTAQSAMAKALARVKAK